jgi:hypothetical protein
MRRVLFIALFVLAGGCSAFHHEPEPPIPHRGDIVAQGSGQLSYRAQAPGLVSIYDVSANAVISSTAVNEGSVVAINPSATNVTVTDANRAGTQVIHSGVSKSHRYELWFIPQSTSTTHWAS